MNKIELIDMREKLLNEIFDKETQEEYLAKIIEDPEFFRKINFMKLDHKEFVLKAIDVLPKGESYLFRKISDNLKDDKDVVLKMVEKSYVCMEFISRRLMKDKDVALVCLKQEGSSLDYLHYDLVDELVENNIKEKIGAIKYLEVCSFKEELNKELSKQEVQPKKIKL